MPETRKEFWKAKFERNVQRDDRNVEQLRRAAWTVIVIWECETVTTEKLQKALRYVLNRHLSQVPTDD